MTTGGPSFGEDGGRLSYGSYLEVPALLELQNRRTQAHDELLFIVVHQVYELWFKELIFEVEAVRDRMLADDTYWVRHYLERVRVIWRVLIQQIEVLETMSPQDFLLFRSELAPASGFQSVQFRELEFLTGLKNAALMQRLECTPAERARLEERLAQPSVADAFRGLLERRGGPSLRDVFMHRDVHGDLFDIAEGLLDLDAAFAQWRARHVLMVERQIGSKSGTGGSTGAAYLRTTLDKRAFPELWEVRSDL